VQAVVAELAGEKIDVIPWSEDASVFVANALSPAQVLGVAIDEEHRIAAVTVPERMLSLAIGREGQNARLAARLTGWRIDIKSDIAVAEAAAPAAAPDATPTAADPEAAPTEEAASDETPAAGAATDTPVETIAEPVPADEAAPDAPAEAAPAAPADEKPKRTRTTRATASGEVAS
jgi:N utilization substance protein A